MSKEKKTKKLTKKQKEEKAKEKARQAELDKKKRAFACTQELRSLLEKHNCYLDVEVRIGTDQKITGEAVVQAR